MLLTIVIRIVYVNLFSLSLAKDEQTQCQLSVDVVCYNSTCP